MADLSKIKLNGTEYDLKDAVARIILGNKANTADLAGVAFSGDYNDLINVPSSDEEDDRYTYDLTYVRSTNTWNFFNINNPKEDTEEMNNEIKLGKAKLNRIFTLDYDPFDELPLEETTGFPEYTYLGQFVNSYSTNVLYRRIISFDDTGEKPFLDIVRFQYANSTGALNNNVYHYYVQLFDGVMVVVDSAKDEDNPYPHTLINFSSKGIFGKLNKASVKAQRAGWLSNFNFKLRVVTHNDNVWLSPVETISTSSVPTFIGESEKLGKRIVVTFDNFTDDDYPTGTIDMEELPHAQLQADWNQTDDTAVDYIKNKPMAISVFTNDAGYLTAHQDISGKANITDLPLIITASCNFTSSLVSGVDTPLEVTNVSKTYADIAEAVSNNRPVKMIVSNGNLRVNLELTAFDGNIYYFTNSYDPFTMMNEYDNESFNITVKASQAGDNDVFTWIITYNKNVFAKKSEVQEQINEAIGGITEFDTQVVQSLPQTGVEGTIYFTPNNHGANDAYDEFIYVNNAWEKIGNTQVDLSGYVRTNDLALVATSGDYNNLNNTPDIPEKTSDLTNDSGFITLADIPVELPIVSNTDNDKVLTVDNGVWTAKTPAIQFSGDYNDLTNKPTLFDGDYNSLSNKPTLFSGDYEDLSNKPTIPSATVVTQTITSGIKIAEINGTAIYAPAYANGDQIAY